MDNYVSGKKASEILGVCQLTLRKWDEKKVIDTIRASGGKRLYNVKKYMENKNIHNQPLVVNNPIIQEKMLYKNKYLYARVSTLSQKEDLERQIKVLTDKYPKYKLITDIGSGMNLNRKGLRSIIDKAIK